LSASGGTLAVFTGSPTRVVVESIAGDRARVTVRDRDTGPALVVRAYLEAHRLPLYAARDLPIVPGHVSVPRDEPVTIAGPSQVSPRYGDFTSLVVEAPCDATTFAFTRSGTTHTKVDGDRWVHLATREVRLFGAPEGDAILTLRATRDGPSFVALEDRSGRTHVRYRDGVAIDGWLRADDLLAGFGPDCDDCHGWPLEVADSCPCAEPTEDIDGCPNVTSWDARATLAVPVRTAADESAAPIGELEAGASVCARETKGSFTRVVASGGLASPGTGFWVPTASLAP
jgi:hypothetical protein